MEERIAKLEAVSDSTVAAVAALRTDMNDRFKLVDVQLAELRRQKVETDVILGRLDAQALQIADLRQYIEQRFTLSREETNLRFDQIDHQFKFVDQQFKSVDQQFKSVDQQFKNVDQRFNQIDERLDDHTYQIKELRSDFRFLTRWLIGTQLTIVLFLLGLAAKMFYPS